MACALSPATGTQVVLYVDGFGRFEGQVARREAKNFGVRFSCTPLKRERTAEQLTLFLNKALVDEGAMRRHERTNHKGFAKFTRADGQIVQCEVMDISAGGVSLRTDMRPALGEFVLIAQMAGRVARHHEHGIGIEFVGQEKAPQPSRQIEIRLDKFFIPLRPSQLTFARLARRGISDATGTSPPHASHAREPTLFSKHRCLSTQRTLRSEALS